tara:strand:- start:4459 stop:4935 length:477 start_codon:yes stop_codon:yes gene_type:complete
MAWEKDTKGFYHDTHTIPPVTDTGATSYSDWFNYSDFGESFREFTFVFNYLDVDLSGTGLSNDSLGVSIDLQWDPSGEAQNTAIVSGVVETETDYSANQMFTSLLPDHVFTIVPDIDLASGAVSSANIMRFRFKFGWDMNTGETWNLNKKIKLAIVPM